MYSVMNALPYGDRIISIALLLYVILKTRLSYFGVATHIILCSLLALIGGCVRWVISSWRNLSALTCVCSAFFAQLPWLLHTGHYLRFVEALKIQDPINLLLPLK